MPTGISNNTPQVRRNGQLQACEPCRNRKIRCDHGLPSCGRCIKRKQECYYHPAPLSQTKRHQSSSATPLAPAQNNPSMPSSDTPATSAAATNPSEVWQATPVANPRDDEGPRALEVGYLGSTSFSEVFKASEHSSDDIWLGPLTQVRRSLRTTNRYRLSYERVIAGVRLLSLIADRQDLKKTLEMYYLISMTVVIPWITLDKAVDSITQTLQNEFKTDSQRLKLSENIFAKTGEPLELDENITAERLHETFTGPNLRWEILGLVFTYFALGLQTIESDSKKQATERQDMIAALVHASNACVSYCDRAESLNDLLVWLLHSNTILLSAFYGDTNHLVWRRCGELTSTIMAMGFHQDPASNPKLPVFIKELRRRAFAISYSTDKMISTFFGRPPRLPIRYCTCRPPLDLTDEDEIAATHLHDSTTSNLDRSIHRQTFACIMVALNIILEEVLELSLVPPASDGEQRQKAQTILDKAATTWNTIPSFAKYTDACWDSDLSSDDCFTFLYFSLHMNYCEFLLYRVQARHGGCAWSVVHLSASQLLSKVLNISKHRDRIRGMWRDSTWMTLLYGLPSAALLAIELLRQQQQQQQQNLLASVEISRSETIRNLSVFVSSLDWVAKPNQGNYDLCQGAKVMLEKVLEAILDPRPTNAVQGVQHQAPIDPVSWIDDVFSNGWMASGPFGDGGLFDEASMYGIGTEWPFAL